MHNHTDMLGSIIKTAREESGKTVESVDTSIGISERYLYRIENEGHKPSFDVLNKLIHLLSIPPDKIFYPEKPSKDSEIENLLRLVSDCNPRALDVVKATVKALIKTDCNK